MTLPLSRSEVGEQSTGKQVWDTLTLAYVPFVRALANRVYETLPSGAGVELGDLVQAGIVGLVCAAKTFNHDTGVPFAIHARYRILGEMLDTLRRLDVAPRHLRRFERKMKAVSQHLTTTLQREPTDDEVLQEMGLNEGEARVKCRALAAMRSAARPDTAPEVASRPESRPDSICARRQWRGLLGQAAGRLTQRQRRLIALYYSDEYTMKQIAEVLRVNESRICQIHKSALQQMARTLKASGIHGMADLEA
jgi:RNA polymerase sigma factor for flagellar operon FliA